MDERNCKFWEVKTPIPTCIPNFEEFSKQMRINQEIIMKEISDHVDKEIERLKKASKDG